MSEIEKMYRNSGIKKIELDYPDNFEPFYPEFTAEKQLELIKLLSYYYNITISKNFENDYTFQCRGDNVGRYFFTSGQDFAEQLAAFINMCYELLPEEEKQQVKGILE